MTASWGGFGVIWNKNICCVRHQAGPAHARVHGEGRHVHALVLATKKYRSALDYCGSHSGRDVDKAAATGLTPVAGDSRRNDHFRQAADGDRVQEDITSRISTPRISSMRVSMTTTPCAITIGMYFGEVVNILLRSE